MVPESVHADLPLAGKYGGGCTTVVAQRMSALRKIGVPYTDEEIAGAEEAIKGKTEMDAVIAYLQALGTALPKVKGEDYGHHNYAHRRNSGFHGLLHWYCAVGVCPQRRRPFR